jgi:4,5-dihydroxyphthalate decarboxylase
VLCLTAACTLTDRVADLVTGAVRPAGIDLTVLPMEPREAFRRIKWTREFHVGEMSLAQYALEHGRDDDLVALPAFTARVFRHRAVYVRGDGPVREPGDLGGGRVGVLEYQMSAAVWARGMLSDQFGVDLDSIEWVTGGLRDPGRRPLTTLGVEGVRVRHEAERSLESLLADGAIDAIISPQAPTGFERRDGTVRRLFDDPMAAERQYLERTGIFPIMHCVVLRRELYEREPWAARSLYEAFDLARANALGRLRRDEPLPIALPWVEDAVRQTEEAAGSPTWWPYGVAANRTTLEALSRYLEEQHLATDRIDPASLFPRSVLDGEDLRAL